MKTLNIAELTANQLGNQNTIRENSKRGDEIAKIPLDKITVRENFNVREDYGDIEGLANSILENGQTLPGRVDILETGYFLLVDGHRRFKALQLLAEQGHEPYFLAIVNGKRTTEEQRILQMFTSQDNKQLEPVEVAELIQRLVNLGYKAADVAKKIGKSDVYVSQMLSFSAESPVIKEAVKEGHLTVTTALKLKKEIPLQSERNKAVIKAVSNKSSEKKTGLQVSDIAETVDSYKALKIALDEINENNLSGCKIETWDFVCGIIRNEYTTEQILKYFAE